MIPRVTDALKLYVIPDTKLGKGRNPLEQAEAALAGGATTIQLRDKHATGRELFELATAMKQLCELYDALFVVNDRLDIALAMRAHGVHVGPSDIPIEHARRLFPQPMIVGASVGTPQAAMEAEKLGVDYLGVGAIYETGTKQNAVTVGIDRLIAVREVTKLPIVAIGGITTERIAEVMAVNPQGVAMISAIVGAEDIVLAAREARNAVDTAIELRS